MSIGVIGAGAIGLLLASTISTTTDVSLYVRRDDQRELIKQNGICILGGPTPNKERIHLKDADDPWEEDLLILAVKQPSLNSIFKDHQNPGQPGQSLLFIQNGMDHLELMNQLKFDHLFIGVIEHGVRKINDYTIEWRGMGRIRCGVYKGEEAHLRPLFHHTLLNGEFAEDWMLVLKDKLLVNAVINPLTALYKIENGQLFTNPHFHQLAFSVFEEAADVLDIPQELRTQKWTYIRRVGETTASNHSSMRQDLEAGKTTEIEAILGYLMRRQRFKKGNHPLKIIPFIYESIKGLEMV